MRVLGVMGRAGAEVGVVEAEVLVRLFVEEDLLGDAMAFAWARRRRSIDGGVAGRPEQVTQGRPGERGTRTTRLSRVVSRVT